VLLFATGLILAIAVHLVPLPPEIWQALPGRELAVKIDAEAGAGSPWRPLSLAPSSTWNALYALLPPVAVVLLAVQLRPEDFRPLSSVLVALLALQLGVGFLQAVVPAGTFRFYEIASSDVPTGLIANRNHFAVYIACMLPLLAAWIGLSERIDQFSNVRGAVAVVILVFAAVLDLMTASRSGAVIGAIGFLVMSFFYQVARGARKGGGAPNVGKWAGYITVILVLVGCLLALSKRNSLFVRMDAVNPGEEPRWAAWQNTLTLIRDHFPFGSGWSTFIETYQVIEPDNQLRIEYWNHAHNEFLEVVAGGGVLGIGMLLTALIMWLVIAIRLTRLQKIMYKEYMDGWVGIWIVSILGLASIVDYPLRTPTLSCFFALGAVWASRVPRRK